MKTTRHVYGDYAGANRFVDDEEMVRAKYCVFAERMSVRQSLSLIPTIIVSVDEYAQAAPCNKRNQ